jgi:hypothetical protein
MVGKPVTSTPEQIDGSNSRLQHYMTAKTYQGQFGGIFDPPALRHFLRNHFGRDVQATAQVLTTTKIAAYSHALYPTRKTNTLSIEEGIGDGSIGRLTSGCVVTNLEITLGEILTYMATITGHAQIPNAYAVSSVDTDFTFTSSAANLPVRMGSASTKVTTTPTFVDTAQGNQGNGGLVFAGNAFGAESGFSATYLTINGSSFTDFEWLAGSKIVSNRALESAQYGGTGYDSTPMTSNGAGVSGTLNFTYKAADLLNAALAHKTLAINLKFVGSLMGTSTIYSAVEFHIPRAKVNAMPLNIGMGMMQATIDFDAIYDSTAGYEFKLTTYDTTDCSAWGDATGTYSGNLGGIVIS